MAIRMMMMMMMMMMYVQYGRECPPACIISLALFCAKDFQETR